LLLWDSLGARAALLPITKCSIDCKGIGTRSSVGRRNSMYTNAGRAVRRLKVVEVEISFECFFNRLVEPYEIGVANE
jgi:hypothetical protein